MIMKRNITRWKKYILGFVIAIFMLLCFGQHRVQAAITRENTQDGFKLSGTGTMDVQSGNSFRYYLGYQVPSEESMDYRVDVTMTFPNTELTPGRVSVWLGDNSTYLYPNGSNVLQGSGTFNESDELEFMEIFTYYDSYISESYVDFNITVNVRENRKNADITIYPPEKSYDKTTGTFLVTVDDPYVLDPLKDTSKYSVSISDSSVGKVTGITPRSGDSVDVNVYFYFLNNFLLHILCNVK